MKQICFYTFTKFFLVVARIQSMSYISNHELHNFGLNFAITHFMAIYKVPLPQRRIIFNLGMNKQVT